ncbi:MAG: hypothetical protein Q4C76_06575 [Bacillota bacterium]|nr:hypothetical protein [Bacillota bacterium]
MGGDLDAIGWAEFIWDSQGRPTAGSSVLGASSGQEDAPWLQNAMEELALPWAGF